ncbi:MAG: hypoxanthine phosphoribosyltransferase [Planctomycetota bacterium]
MSQPPSFAQPSRPPLPAHRLTPLITEEELRSRVGELATEISNDYRELDPVFIGVLQGAFMFVADLIRAIDYPVTTEFIRVSSYGTQVVTSGEVKMELDLASSIANRHVILVEDIVDTGLTLDYLKANLAARNPGSIKVCSLLHKPENNVKLATIEYLGFNIPNKFVVGYGLDYKGYYRNLPHIAEIEEIKVKI